MVGTIACTCHACGWSVALSQLCESHTRLRLPGTALCHREGDCVQGSPLILWASSSCPTPNLHQLLRYSCIHDPDKASLRNCGSCVWRRPLELCCCYAAARDTEPFCDEVVLLHPPPSCCPPLYSPFPTSAAHPNLTRPQRHRSKRDTVNRQPRAAQKA